MYPSPLPHLCSGRLPAVAVLLLTAVAAVAQKPPEVHPGDPAVDGSFIHPYTNKWKMFQLAPDGSKRETGSWSDEVKILQEDGEKRIQRTQVIFGPDGSKQNETVNLVAHRTLLPKQFRRSGGGRTMVAEFDRKTVKMGTAQSFDKTVELSMPVFDWTLYGLLLAAFPLQEGYSARFPYFAGNTSGFQTVEWMSFEVKGRERVAAGPGRELEAWLVETGEGWKFWLTKQSPYVIRLEVPFGGGGRQVWEMM